MKNQKSPAVFLDRDGTIIRDVNYLQRAEQVEILVGAAEGIKTLRDAGFRIVVVTNQSAIARGMLTEDALAQIHRYLSLQLAAEGAAWDALYYCPHHPTAGHSAYTVCCDCRKPKPGLVHRACAELALDPRLSYVVGDQISDIELAMNIGARGAVLIQNEAYDHQSAVSLGVTRVANLAEAALWITERATCTEGR